MNGNLAYQGRREELIGGKAVAMSPRRSFNHNRVASNIFWIFESYLDSHQCTPIADGMDLYLNEENKFVPDFMVVRAPDKIRPDGIHGAPDLVVEVLSPSTILNDKTHKKEVYASFGVREYWLVDPISKAIEVYYADGGEFVLHNIYVVHPDWELEKMSEEDRAAVKTHFKCSLFNDLDISIERIFYRTF